MAHVGCRTWRVPLICMARRADELHDRVVVVNPEEDCSPAAFRLLIDELSLGLSPIMVQELLQVVERLKGEGTTIIIVEQSLNVALAMADRAVFLEKGEVRFEGDAQELLERDDLARAVFLGREGG